MFKIFKKIIITLILIVTLFEFSFGANFSYGMTEDEAINGVTNLAGGIVSILLWKQRITVAAIALGMNILTQNLVKSYGFKDGGTSNFVTQNTITPFNIFFNKYNLLDINFFNIDGSGNANIQKIREGVAKWYHTMQVISASVSLVVLIYVAIRMAISTVAEEQAKYKQMLVDWAMSVLLLFIMHFIIIFIIYLNDTLVSALEIALTSLENGSPQGDAIQNLITNLAIMSVLSIGITSITALIVFVLIVFQTIMFLVAYVIRMIKVAFLLIIAPLVTITYPLDKMGDGQAQAFNNWLKEFIFTVLIQPFHCIIYYAFAGVALNIMIESYKSVFDMNVLANGVLAVMCIKFIGDGEKIVKHIFHFGEPKDGALATGAAITLAALSNMQKWGESARIGTNNMKNAFANVRADGTARINQIQGILNNSDSKVAKGIAKGMNNVGSAASKGMSAIKDNSVVQGISGTIGSGYNKVSRTIRGVKQEHINLKRKIASSGKLESGL